MKTKINNYPGLYEHASNRYRLYLRLLMLRWNHPRPDKRLQIGEILWALQERLHVYEQALRLG